MGKDGVSHKIANGPETDRLLVLTRNPALSHRCCGPNSR